MSSLGGPETESAAAKWLRKPLVIGLAIIDTVAGSFRIAGASAQFMRRSLREAAVRQYEPIFASKSREWSREAEIRPAEDEPGYFP